MRVMAVVSSPTREQLEGVGHPGVVFAAHSERSRAPPVGQLELPMRQRAAGVAVPLAEGERKNDAKRPIVGEGSSPV